MVFTERRFTLAMTEMYMSKLVVLAYATTMVQVLGYSQFLQTSKQLHIFGSPTMMTSFLPTVSDRASLVVESVMSRLCIAHAYGTNRIEFLCMLCVAHVYGIDTISLLCMCCVRTRARRLSVCFVFEATAETTIPPDILPLVDDESGTDVYAGVDKAATPAERPSNPQALSRDLDRARPLLLLPQRDSDANKEVMASRAHAWDQITQMTIARSSSLIKQFLSTYVPRVFHLALPYLVGGPDFPRQPRPRRCVDRDSPDLTLGAWNAMIASNCLSQLRWDWELVPEAWSPPFCVGSEHWPIPQLEACYETRRR